MKTVSAIRVALMIFMLPAVSGLARETAAASEEKKYVLFMGSDLAVQRDKKSHRVLDVEGSEFKIKIGKKDFFVPTRNRRMDLKVSHSLKLAAVSVKLDGLYAGPAYTPANDPVRKMIAASGSSGGASAVEDLAQGQLMRVAEAEAHAARVAAAYPTIPEAQEAWGKARVELRDAELKAAAGTHMLRYDSQNSAAAAADKMQGDLAEGNHDAMEVSFKVSSPVELDDPHMVILFKFQERDAKPGTAGMLIHAEEIDYIGPKPRYVRVRQGGVPPGFKYLDCEVHIFNRGMEVATSESSKRVELSADEARQYLLIEHLAANKDATLPAQAIAGSLPMTVRDRLSPDQLNRVCYAKVSKEGLLLGLYADESASLPLADEMLAEAFADALFKPAVAKGKPMDGLVRVRLAELTL